MRKPIPKSNLGLCIWPRSYPYHWVVIHVNDIRYGSAIIFEPGQPALLSNPIAFAYRYRYPKYRSATSSIRDMYSPDNWRVAYQVGPGLVLFSSIKKVKPKHG